MIACGITTYSRSELLLRCLREYSRNVRIPTSFYIYQDGNTFPLSADAISHGIGAPHRLAHSIFSRKNKGIAYGRMTCADAFMEKGKEKYWLNLDDDAVARRGGIETLVDILVQKPEFGIAGASNYRSTNFGILSYPFMAGFCWMTTRQLLEHFNFDPKTGPRDDADFYTQAWVNGNTPVCTKIAIQHKRMHSDPKDPQHLTSDYQRDAVAYMEAKWAGLLKVVPMKTGYSLRRTAEYPKPPNNHFRFSSTGRLVKHDGPAPVTYVRRSEVHGSNWENSAWFKEIGV